uniref:Uncharacterized protein n=1 Tax=Vespula pensylvanica TaxID=30213 RepID=A0A834JQ68_VESPE|nr:hypothetical protein H0235_017094 [Vespula pensylvanica]
MPRILLECIDSVARRYAKDEAEIIAEAARKALVRGCLEAWRRGWGLSFRSDGSERKKKGREKRERVGEFRENDRRKLILAGELEREETLGREKAFFQSPWLSSFGIKGESTLTNQRASGRGRELVNRMVRLIETDRDTIRSTTNRRRDVGHVPATTYTPAIRLD